MRDWTEELYPFSQLMLNAVCVKNDWLLDAEPNIKIRSSGKQHSFHFILFFFNI